LSQWQADPTNRWLDWEWLLRVDSSGSVMVARTAGNRRKGSEGVRPAALNYDPLDLIETHLIAPAVVKLRRARRGMICHRGGLF
jgi:hypothetical protein